MAAIEYYSYSDYVQWEGNWELIHGYPLMMAPSPMIIHQILASLMLVELSNTLTCDECIVIGEQDWKISDETI